jgi:rod shape-determining protein MreD
VSAAGLAIAAAVLLQGTVVARLPLPGGTPNLALLLVVAVGLAAGPSAGLGCGFTAGIVIDLLSNHPVGLVAVCLALTGFGVGLLEARPVHGTVWFLVVVAVAAAGAQLLYTALIALLAGHVGSALADLPSTVAYDVMLSPFVVPVVAAAERRLRSAA